MELTTEETRDVLERGAVGVVGRMRYASNGTFLVEVTLDGAEVPAVYKPLRGERPLWDFPQGTLGRREVAAYELSHALGWDVVPLTVLRDDGPLGEGSLQLFVDHDPEEHYFTLLAEHEDRFRQLAAFDILANNADRKSGHCLRDRAHDVVIGIDHGLTFHPQWKVRTVIWDFAGEAVPPAVADAVCRMSVDATDGALAARLAELLSPFEQRALTARATELLREGTFPEPEPGYHSVPWPVV